MDRVHALTRYANRRDYVYKLEQGSVVCNGGRWLDGRPRYVLRYWPHIELFPIRDIETICGLWRMIRDILRPAKRGSEGFPE